MPIRHTRRIILLFFLWIVSAAAACGRGGELVTPGKCAGRICLGDTRQDVRRVMNKKPVSLTRRQLPIDVWQSKDCRELLLVVYQAGRVAEIHLNSPSYKTANGISISSTFREVAEKFPDGKALEYAVFETGKNRVDWDVPQHGIVFSMAGDQDGPMVRMAIYQPRSSKLIGYSQGDAWYWNPECSSKRRP